MMKFVIIIIVFGLLAFVAIVESEKFKCNPDVLIYKENCNKCRCIQGGKPLLCTKMGCGTVKDCKIGITYMKDCNRCWCVRPRTTVCEDKKC